MASSAWERTGKSEFLKQFKNTIKDNQSPVFYKSDKKNASTLIYDLISHGIKGQIRKDSVLATLGELAQLQSDVPSIIVDVFGIMDAETSINNDVPAEERNTYCYIARESEKFLSDKLLKERLEIDTLQDIGTLKNKNFYTKFIKVKTKLYYKQRRFNLFREESEGYAKLITELNQDFNETVTVTGILEIIKSLIGCFNLDPNRVLDIILESFETRSDQDKMFIPLLNLYMPDGHIICEVLGYKFRHFSDQKTPESLYKLTAVLLQNKVIQLNDIYTWLSPTDKSIIADWESEIASAKEFVRKLNIISTNKDKEIEQEPEKEVSIDKYVLNQKWGLCEALLMIGDWTNAQVLIKKLPDQCVIVNERIAVALCRLIHIVIDPVYRLNCSLTNNIKSRTNPNPLNKLAPPQVTSMAKLKNHAFPMFVELGASLHYDPVLMTKLLRMMKTILQEMNVDPMNTPVVGSDDSLYYEILSLLDTTIMPALSYMDCNCCIAEEIWTILKFYPYQYRFSLYGRWKNETYSLQPKLIRRRGEAQKQIKALMKRVSKENVKPVGRLIGKLSHCSPGFLFDYILLQIQIYENLIGPVVDSLKYLTSLSYDVLGYCLIEALAQADRDRFKHDGTSVSLWLQSLANFCGAIYKKYNIELSGLMQYVANQLKSQKSLDLLILKEIVQKMAGVEAAEEMTQDQINAMGGGELLRAEAGYFSQVRNTKKSSQRLKDALANNDLAVALCLLIAQQKFCVIYRETSNSHLKLVGKLYDQCQDTLVQFGTFLGSNYSVEEYVERLPSIHGMLQEYHIKSDVAFFLARPMFAHAIQQKYDQLRKSDPNSKKLSTAQKQAKYLEASQYVMNPVIESVRPLHATKVWEDISPEFLVTFWSLSMYDLHVPVESYQKEISKLKQMASGLSDSKESKSKKEQERYTMLIEKLQDERKKQQDHVDKIMHRLQCEKDSWFLSRSAKSAKNETITQFLLFCLFPRCTFTVIDAIYCAKFVQVMHSLKTQNFSTLLCYDRIFCDITYSVTSCTENEATRYGRFLCAMLETVMRWHRDQAIFNKECADHPGFITKFRVSNQFSEANDHVGFENYRHVCHKWHYKITKALVFCLDSKDYMQIRNSLIILMRILPFFPVLAKLSQIIEKKVEKVREDEKNKRQDLFVLASSYIGQLKAKSSQMMKESDFHQVSEKPVKESAETKVVNGDAKVDKKEIKVEKRTAAVTPVSTSTKSSVSAQPLNNVEKDIKKEVPTKDAKEIKKEERSREKEREREEGELRKREKRREKRTHSPTYYDIPPPAERYYPDHYEQDRSREKDRSYSKTERDLSSVSNSSNEHRRSHDPSEHEREMKRRKVESSNSKKHEDITQVVESKKKSSKTREKIEDKEVRKEKKISRKRDREPVVEVIEKRRKETEDDLRDKHNHIRSKSPYTNRDHRPTQRERR